MQNEYFQKNFNFFYSSGAFIITFSDLFTKYKVSEFNSPLRSTVLMLDYWRETDLRLNQLFHTLQINEIGNLDLCFEYKVPVKGGSGRASQTDSMIYNNDLTIGIEAKYKEPPYKKVSEWLGNISSNKIKPIPSNRENVLNEWLEHINNYTKSSLSITDIKKINYQLIHRTASVCALPGKDKHVIYQCFNSGNLNVNYYRTEFENLKSKLNPKTKLKFHLHICNIKSNSPKYDELVRRWEEDKERKLSSEVIDLLRTEQIFAFECNLRTIY